MTLSQISEKLAETCKSNESINLLATLPEEFFYNSLDLCIIDAVFSIGVKYEGVKNVVRKYQKHLEHAHPALSKRSRTTSEAISVFESYSSILDFAKDVLHMADLGFKQISVEPVVAPPEAEYALTMEDIPTLVAQYDELAAEMQ